MAFHKTYAEEVASLLDAEFPEFGLAPAPDRPVLEQRSCFSFQVACPATTVTPPLSVFVTEHEITIEFLKANYQTPNPEMGVAKLREIFDETTLVDSWYSGPYFRGCGFVEARNRPGAPDGVRGVTRIVRRSWWGTHDGKITID